MIKHRYRLSKLPNMTKTPYFPIFSIVFYIKTMENLRIHSFWWRHAFQILKSHRNHWAKCHWLLTKWTLKWQDTEVVHLTANKIAHTFRKIQYIFKILKQKWEPGFKYWKNMNFIRIVAVLSNQELDILLHSFLYKSK